MTINKDKYELNCDKVSYFGYQISKDGISLDEIKIAIKKKAEKFTPGNQKEFKSFWELKEFYRIYPNTWLNRSQSYAKKVNLSRNKKLYRREF